jgi:hypothetical protein
METVHLGTTASEPSARAEVCAASLWIAEFSGGRRVVKPRSMSRFVVVALTLMGARSVADSGPILKGRAVLPAETLAPGPACGTLLTPGVTNGIAIPWPSQVVQGFSALAKGREPGEYLAMPDNGFGAKAPSKDFLLRAYYVGIDFKTARGGKGEVEVRDFISFRDPDHKIGFPIVNETTEERELTGFDLDPESLQRDHNGTSGWATSSGRGSSTSTPPAGCSRRRTAST